jgi:hypothetical protein
MKQWKVLGKGRLAARCCLLPRVPGVLSSKDADLDSVCVCAKLAERFVNPNLITVCNGSGLEANRTAGWSSKWKQGHQELLDMIDQAQRAGRIKYQRLLK